MAVVLLRSGTLLALVDPTHGGEVVDLIDLRSGTGLLGRPPFAAAPPVTGAMLEDEWVASYRGGWQLAAPNAGNASAGHPFHGAASTEPWSVEAVGERSLRLRWEGFGLTAERTLHVDDEAVEAEVEWRAAGSEPAPLVTVEHLTVGLALLDPAVRLTLPGGRALELDTGHPPAGDGAAWPEATLLDGGRERIDRFGLDDAGARFLLVRDLPAGRLDAVNERSGIGLALEWDVAALPFLWIWRETRASGGPWRGRGEMLGLEPSSVPHDAGMAGAIDSGHAVRVRPDQPFRHHLRATLLPVAGSR